MFNNTSSFQSPFRKALLMSSCRTCQPLDRAMVKIILNVIVNNQAEGFVEVKTWNLIETLCYKPGFGTVGCAICVFLNFKYALALKWLFQQVVRALKAIFFLGGLSVNLSQLLLIFVVRRLHEWLQASQQCGKLWAYEFQIQPKFALFGY